MKSSSRLLLTAIAALVTTTAFATDWQTTTDVVWGGRNYRELDGLAIDYSESDSPITWNYADGTKVIYAIHIPNGHVRADMEMQCSSAVTFNVRITHPVSGTLIIDHTVVSKSGTSDKQLIEILPDTEMPADGWYFIEFTSPDARQKKPQINSLNFQRTSTKNVTAANSMMAPFEVATFSRPINLHGSPHTRSLQAVVHIPDDHRFQRTLLWNPDQPPTKRRLLDTRRYLLGLGCRRHRQG